MHTATFPRRIRRTLFLEALSLFLDENRLEKRFSKTGEILDRPSVSAKNFSSLAFGRPSDLVSGNKKADPVLLKSIPIC